MRQHLTRELLLILGNGKNSRCIGILPARMSTSLREIEGERVKGLQRPTHQEDALEGLPQAHLPQFVLRERVR
jgi:hypothetical protein